MPATYRKRGASSENYKRRSWMPEPVKPVDRRIFGYEVETATFNKYNHQNYSIGFCFYDLAGVERWATDPDRAAEFPEKAAEAKQIMERIIAEITGKDMKTMKTPRTAADFIDALNEIYTATRAVYTEMNNKLVKARAKMENGEKDTRDSSKDHRLAEAQYLVAKGEFQLAEDEARRGYYDMIASYDKQVKELREQFASHLEEHYSASPDRLDTSTMQLLGSGICTPVELARLVDRHQGNPTMLRIVGEYARKLREDNRRSMSHENQVICTNVANAGYSAKDGSRELAIFDSAASATKYGLGKDYDHATRMHGHMGGWFDDFKQNMNNLPVIPEEMAPTAAEPAGSGE